MPGSLSSSITRLATLCVVARLTSVAIASAGSSPSRWVSRIFADELLAGGSTTGSASAAARPARANMIQSRLCRRTASNRNRNVTRLSGG